MAYLDTKASFMDNQNLRLHVTDEIGDRPRIAASGSVSIILGILA